jgi:adhesin transport system outer membrane protein
MSKATKTSTLAFAVVSLGLTASAVVQAQSLTEVVQKALADYPAIRASQSRTETARADIARARSQHFPQIGVAATANNYSSATSSNSTLLSPTARLNLWSGGRIEAEAQRAEALTRAAVFSQAIAQDEVALLATEAYLNWARTADLYQLAVRNVYAHQETLEDIRKISQVDTGRRIDFQQAQVRMENANLALQQRKADMLQAIERVRRFWTGEMQGRPQSLDQDLMPYGALGQMPASLDEALESLERRSPAVSQALAQVEAAQFAVRQAQGLRWPTVDLSSSRTTDPLSPSRQTMLTQVQLNMPVYNGGQTNAQIAAAVSQLQTAQSALDEARLLAREKVALAWQEWSATRSRIEVGKSQSEVGDQVVEGYRAQFRLGRRSLLDLLNIQADAFNYRTAARASTHEERIARARLLAAMGSLAARFPSQGEIPPAR